MSPEEYANQFIYPEDLSLVIIETKKAIKTTDPNYSNQIEHRIIYSNGEIGYVLVQIFITKDEHGRTIKTHGVNQDITDRVLKDEKIRKNEERLRLILDSTPFPIAIVDIKDEIIQYWSQSAKLLFGHTANTTSEWYQMAYPDPDYRAEVIKHWKPSLEKALLSNQYVNTGEYNVTCSDGSVRICELYASFLADNLIVTFNDITERKLSEELLHKSENQYSELVANMLDGVYQSTPDGKFISVNNAMVKMFGYDSIDEMLRIDIKNDLYLHEDDRGNIYPETGKENQPELCLKRKDGSLIWVEDSGWYIRDDNGNVIRHEGILRDITERKFAEETLKKSEENYRILFEYSPLGILVSDLNGKILRINSSLLKILGSPSEEMTKKINLLTFKPLVDSGLSELLQNTIIDQKEIIAERKYQSKWGKTLNMLVYSKPIFDHNSKLNSIQIIVQDISERIKAEEALKHSEKKYKYLFETNPQAMWIYDLETLAFLEVNESAIERYGYTKDEFFNLTIKDIRPSEDIKALLDDVAQTVNILNKAGVWRHKKKNGEIIFAEITSHLIDYDKHEARLVLANDVTEQKIAEEALRLSEQKYRLIFDLSPIGIYQSTREGKFLTVNNTMCKILGYNSVEELLEVNMAEGIYFRKEEREYLILEYEPKGSIANHEVQWKMKDGRPVWVQLNVYTVKDSTGKLKYFEGNVQDITVRKHAEEAIKESENRYRILIESFYDMIYLTNFNNKMIYSNPSLEIWTGYTMDDFNKEGSKIKFVHSEDVEYVETFIEDFKNSDKKYSKTLNNRFVTKTGDIRWHSTIISKVNYSGDHVLQFICRDITLQKKNEVAIIESEEKYRRLHETMTDCFVQTDMSGQIVSVNKSYKEMLGYTSEEVFKLKCLDITPAKWADMENYILEKQILPRGYSDVYEKEYIRKDGTVFPIEIRVFLLKDSKGVPSGMWAIIRDITERKKIEETILHINEELEQRVKIRTAQLEDAYNEMEAFTYSVSHDLRAPLRAIDGFSKMLLQDYSDIDPEAVRLLNIICQSSGNMGKLIDDLLVFSRVGRANIATAPLKMKEIVSFVITQIKRENATHKAVINISELVDLPGDKTLITQIWTNLINNAIKFSSKTQDPIVEIGCYAETKEVVYFVKDNGVGFDMKYVDKLFGVFQRLHSVDEFDGTGIGLAIVRKAIIRQGGRVWAESEEGKGAAFFFTLPLI